MGRSKKKGKSIQPKQIPQLVKAEPSSDPPSISDCNMMMKQFQSQPEEVFGDSFPNISPITNPNRAPSGWRYCTEDQLGEILLQSMRIIYSNVISHLVSMGYDHDSAVKAIQWNGHCYGDYDVATNILQNTLVFLTNSSSEFKEPLFSDLKNVEECSLASMVNLLQQSRPGMSRGDAMYRLLISEFHFGRAKTLTLPVVGRPDSFTVSPPSLNVYDVGSRFRNEGGSSSAAEKNLQLHTEIEIPKRYNLPQLLQDSLKSNVALLADSFRAHSEQMQSQAMALPGVRTGSKMDVSGAESVDSHNLSSQVFVNLVLSKFHDINLDEKLMSEEEDLNDIVVDTLEKQIEDYEKQVKERKDWAHQKAIQAARTLSSKLNELRMLRMDRQEYLKIRKVKQDFDDMTFKRLEKIESFLRETNGQVDQANAAMARQQNENAKIKAEVEATKLSASESAAATLQIEKREKKLLKRLQAQDKEKAKLQQDISDVKKNVLEVQGELVRIEQCKQEAEAKWSEMLKAKEDALSLLEEERRAKEAAEANSKRNLRSLHLRIETDFQHRKDDILRLQKEIAQLKSSNRSIDLGHQSNILATSESKDANSPKEKIAKLLEELDNLGFSEIEVNGGRRCIICRKGEVSVLFLPCAHQIMCASCSEVYMRQGTAVCPSCRVPIEERIRVYGASL